MSTTRRILPGDAEPLVRGIDGNRERAYSLGPHCDEPHVGHTLTQAGGTDTSRRTFTRRRFLGGGAALGLVTVSGPLAAGPANAGSRPVAEASTTRLGSVLSTDGVTALVAVDGASSAATLRLRGFPVGYKIASGERVAVTDALTPGSNRVILLWQSVLASATATGEIESSGGRFSARAGSHVPRFRPGTRVLFHIAEDRDGRQWIASARAAAK